MAATPTRHVTFRTVDGVLVARINETQVHGDTQADAIRKELLEAVGGAPGTKIVIDLEAVNYLSSAAFRPLLSLRKKLQETGGKMALCSLHPMVKDVFQVLRLISTSRSYPATFDVQPDASTAIRYLNGEAGQL